MNNKLTQHRDGNVIAAEYDEAICLHLLDFGYLTSRMIAELIRPGDPAGLRTAQRRMKALVKRRLVIRERTDSGIPLYKLSKKGADYLADLGHDGVPERGTRDAKTGNPFHRSLSNNFLIFELPKSVKYWSEYEILRNRAPLNFFKFEGIKMVPDALFDTAEGTFWVEAENAVKRPKRLAQLARLADHLFGEFNGYSFNFEDELYSIRGMLFICPNDARARAVSRAFANPPRGSMLDERVWISHAPMTKSLIWPEKPKIELAHKMAKRLGYIQHAENVESGSDQTNADQLDEAR